MKLVRLKYTIGEGCPGSTLYCKNALEYIDPSGHFVFFMKFGVAQTFVVVLEVSRWLDQNFFFTKLVDIYHRKTEIKMIAL